MIQRSNKYLTANHYSFLLTIPLIALICLSCYKAPVTGRSQFILLSEAEENQIGLQTYQEILKKEKVSNNPNYNNAVRKVGKRIAMVSDDPNYNWEFKVIEDDKNINAFALPGGKVAVYTGLIPVAKSDSGLATVMAHEIAHATARHGGERVTTGILAQIGAAGLSAAIGNDDPALTNAVMQAYGLGVIVGGILPFSRTQEAEADRIGLIYMAKAGYDPREAIAFWSRMENANRGKPVPPEFLSTHPGYGSRISNLRKWMPEAIQIYQTSIKATNSRIQ